MRLKQTGNGLIEPFDEQDVAVFEHCAGGMSAVTEDYFNDRMIILLQAHGESEIEINGHSIY